MRIRTQVGIIGAGPAGLVAATIPRNAGIDRVVLEKRGREQALVDEPSGILEHRIARLLDKFGLARDLRRSGMVENSIVFRVGGKNHRIEYAAITLNATHYVYPRALLVRDLTQAYLDLDGRIRYGARTYTVTGLDSARPTIAALSRYGHVHVECDFVLGRDGEHGIIQCLFPARTPRRYETRDPYAWLAITAAATPSDSCLVAGLSETGAASHARSTAAVSHLYLQCGADDRLSDWPEERIWSEPRARLATADTTDETTSLYEGPVRSTNLIHMRSVVCEPLRHGRPLLVGDAAHVFPQVGGKGMNVALGDAFEFAGALDDWCQSGNENGAGDYSDRRSRHAWRTQEFVHWMMGLVNMPFLGTSDAPFLHRPQVARLERVLASHPYAQALVEDHVGLW